jgi:hypothetical protein
MFSAETGIFPTFGQSSARGKHRCLRAIYSEMGWADGTVFTLVPTDSSVRIRAFRAGPCPRGPHL